MTQVGKRQKQNVQVASAHTGKFLTSPLIKETQIKARHPFYLTDKDILSYNTGVKRYICRKQPCNIHTTFQSVSLLLETDHKETIRSVGRLIYRLALPTLLTTEKT